MNLLHLFVKDILIVKILLYSIRREVRESLHDFCGLLRVVLFYFLLEEDTDGLSLVHRHILARNLTGQALAFREERVLLSFLFAALGHWAVFMFAEVTSVTSFNVLRLPA
jgi:hypothetical protein